MCLHGYTRPLVIRVSILVQGGASGAARRSARCSRKLTRGACGLPAGPRAAATACRALLGVGAARRWWLRWLRRVLGRKQRADVGDQAERRLETSSRLTHRFNQSVRAIT